MYCMFSTVTSHCVRVRLNLESIVIYSCVASDKILDAVFLK